MTVRDVLWVASKAPPKPPRKAVLPMPERWIRHRKQRGWVVKWGWFPRAAAHGGTFTSSPLAQREAAYIEYGAMFRWFKRLAKAGKIESIPADWMSDPRAPAILKARWADKRTLASVGRDHALGQERIRGIEHRAMYEVWRKAIRLPPHERPGAPQCP